MKKSPFPLWGKGWESGLLRAGERCRLLYVVCILVLLATVTVECVEHLLDEERLR